MATRTGTKIYKYDSAGELVYTYSSLTKAFRGEKTNPNKLKEAIESGATINDHTFKSEQIKTPKKSVIEKTENVAPWEGKDGKFKVERWRSVCF